MKFKDMSFKELEKDFKEKLDQYSDEELVNSLSEMEDIKEKTADEMFEELGYGKVRDENNIYFNKYLTSGNVKVIQLKEFIQTIVVYIEDSEGKTLGADSFWVEELQAINKKCKELNWLGDE